LINFRVEAEGPAGLHDAEQPARVDVLGGLGLLVRVPDLAHSGQIVDLVRRRFFHDAEEAWPVRHVSGVQGHTVDDGGEICEIWLRHPADQAVYFIALVEQKLGKIRT
jgi:hypothetical protein